MIVCDLTHAYTPTSGGIRTYIDAKRQYVLEHTPHTHVLIVPGERDEIERGDRWVTYRIKSPVIKGAEPYRFFTRPDKILKALRDARPNVVELNSHYLEPMAAFRYRARRPDALISGYFFTDFSRAYVGPAMSKLLGPRLGAFCERRTEWFIRTLFRNYDLRVAPSDPQADRLDELGVRDVDVVVPGVDLKTFNPGARDPKLREVFGVSDDGLLISYAGRFDIEKRIATMLDAVERVAQNREVLFVLAGEGPDRALVEERAEAGAPVLTIPYQTDKNELSRLMASSDLYLTAGPHETFGLSVLEAQACGLPVVGVDAGALTERVLPGLGFLGPVDDAEAMAANIEKAAADLVALSANAYRHVVENFSWKATFDRLFEVYARELQTEAAAVPEV